MLEYPIIVCEQGGPVTLLRPAGEGWTRSVLAQNGRWPAWNPAKDLIALSVLDAGSDPPGSSIEVIDLEGRLLRTLYESPAGVSPVITPRVPHYALWSPGGRFLSYVAQSSYGLTLFLGDVDGALPGEPIINGAPLFIAWCNDENFLAVHSGTELAVVETQGSRVTAEVAARATGFRTPAFSDDAEILAYAVPDEPGVVVMRSHFQGTAGREVRRFAGGVALAFRPGTQELSVAVAMETETGAFSELWMLDLGHDPAPARLVARGPFVAFSWAPTGDKVVLIVPTQSGDGRYAARALAPDGTFLAATDGVVPSQDYRALLGFFDQYARSHHLWSPDGEWFLLAGRLATDAVSSSFGEPIGDMVLAWRVAKGQPLIAVAPGEIGFFPPARQRIR